MPVFKNHSAFIATPQVIEICRPLKNLNVDFFCYHRVYKDGSEILLSNDINWSQHYYQISGSMHLDAKYAVGQKLDYFVWPYNHDNSQILGQAREISKIFYGVSFIDTHSEAAGYWEIFGFAIEQQLNVNYILSQIPFLKQFCSYFRSQASQLIESCYSDRIVPLEKNLNMFEDMPFPAPDLETNQFLKEIGLEPHQPKWVLTSRELQCIEHLLLGKTASETAKALNISVRTVETHLDNIKSKLHCKKKSELITHLIKMGFAPSAQLLL